MIAAIAAYGWQSVAVDLRDVHAASEAAKGTLAYDASRCVESRLAYPASETSRGRRASWASHTATNRPASAPTRIRSRQ